MENGRIFYHPYLLFYTSEGKDFIDYLVTHDPRI